MLFDAQHTDSVNTMRITLILAIYQASYIAQIYDSVVVFYSVDVVNMVFWPDTVDIKPSKTVCKITLSVNLNLPIAILIIISGNVANVYAVGGSSFPLKHARFWIIV